MPRVAQEMAKKTKKKKKYVSEATVDTIEMVINSYDIVSQML